MMQKIWNPFSRGPDVGGLAEVVHWSHSWDLAMSPPPVIQDCDMRSVSTHWPTGPPQQQQAQTIPSIMVHTATPRFQREIRRGPERAVAWRWRFWRHPSKRTAMQTGHPCRRDINADED